MNFKKNEKIRFNNSTKFTTSQQNKLFLYYNKDQSNNGYIVQTSKNEKELYDKIITQQQNEIGYLRKILDSYVR